jgi:hypothetical protein
VEGKEADCPRCHEPHAGRIMSTFACAGSRAAADDPLLKDLPEDVRRELPPELRNGIPDDVRREIEAAGGMEALAEGAGEEGLGGPEGDMDLED